MSSEKKEYWFTSDTHFEHGNSIKHNCRPFSSIEEMREALIKNWNSVVGPKDIVYHLGDVSWIQKGPIIDDILYALNGVKHLIIGNHDKKIISNKAWESVESTGRVSIGKDVDIYLCHFPWLAWNKSHYGSIHLHGHCHGNLPLDKTVKRWDMGVDCNNYTPVNLSEILLRSQKVDSYRNSLEQSEDLGLREPGIFE